MKEQGNNYAFIGSQNLNLGIRDAGWQLDFARFRVYLRDKYRVAKAFLFIGYVAGNEGLYATLQQAGYIVIFKPTIPTLDQNHNLKPKGNVDAELVLHAIIQYPHYDKAVIVSGDGDFHCLIEYLEQQKKLSRVLIPNHKKYSALLRRFMHFIEYLDGLERKLSGKKHKEGDYPSDEP